MKRLVFILLLLCLPVWCGTAWADSENIEPEATGTPDDWYNAGGANKVASVTDDVDDNRIFEDRAGKKQRFSMANPTEIGGDDTIDSVVTHWRGKDSGTGTNNVQMHQYVGLQSNDGTDVELTTSYADYTDKFALTPDGGAWTLYDINSLRLEAHCTAIGVLKTVSVTKIYATIWYTPAAGKMGQIIIIGGD